MTTTPYRLRVNELAVGAGTTARFALLIILLLVSSAAMIHDTIRGLFGENDLDGLGCLFAAGADPLHSSEIVMLAHIRAQDSAYAACVARFGAPPTWWVTLGWPILVVAVAAAVFWGLPVWKRRRGRVVPLAEIDHDGTIDGELTRLATTVAQLDRTPRFVVDPAAVGSTGAVVFGSNRRPTICLHGGLLVRRTTDPKGFRAVVLHELAHVRNGDVTVTYLTVAVWRVFLMLVLLPHLYWNISALVVGRRLLDWSLMAPGLTRSMVLTGSMVALIYLARSDVLRSREIYADLAAVGWGADRHGWAVPTSPPDSGAVRKAFDSFVELWRTHPRGEVRRASLTDPAVLFGVQALPLFLTGAAAALVDGQSSGYVGRYLQDIAWSREVIAIGVAVLVAAVAGVTLWRAAAHSVLTGRPAPSGVRAGLWLGAGMAAAELVTNDVGIYHWLPSRPDVLLLVICAGVVFAWWSTQCAHVWLRAWPGRTIRPAILLGLTAGCLVLSAWFEWWRSSGALYANGFSLNPFDLPPTVDRAGPGVLLSSLHILASGPLALLAVAAVWVAPLLVWTVGPVTAMPRWIRVVQRRTGDAVAPVSRVPPLRHALVGGVLGGVFGWIALIGVMAYLHTTQPPFPLRLRDDAEFDTYMVGVLMAWVAGMALAAVVASVVASRYRLLAALIASQVAGLVGFVGMFPLAASEGCIPLLATLRGSCAWRPGVTWSDFSYLAGPVFVLGAVAATAAAAVVSAIQRLRDPSPRTRFAAMAPRSSAGRRGRIVRRLVVAVLCAVTVGLSAADEVSQTGDDAPVSAASASPAAVLDAPVSTQTRASQVAAWIGRGGSDLMDRFIAAARGFSTLLDRSKGNVERSLVHPFCVDFDQIARDADAYFEVPDPQAQALWRTFIAEVRAASQDCQGAVAQSNGDLLTKSLGEVSQAGAAVASVGRRTIAVARAGGL